MLSFILYSWKLNFIKSQFAGQLPQQYQKGPDATKVVPPNMNNMNREEFSRYVCCFNFVYYIFSNYTIILDLVFYYIDRLWFLLRLTLINAIFLLILICQQPVIMKRIFPN